MHPGSEASSNKLTLLVFKDNLASRTFQIPFNWISKFGLILGFLVLTAAISVFAAIKLYLMHRMNISAPTAHTQQIQDMEQTISELKSQLKIAQTSIRTPEVQRNSDTKTATHPAAPSLVEKTILPTTSLEKLPDPATLPFSIEALKLSWRGSSLKVNFALQYNKTDQGTQHGRIIILAGGPETLLAYPEGVFNQMEERAPLLLPNHGESFSVSRYREVKADLGPFKSFEALKKVEILIFNREDQLLVRRKISPPAAPLAAPKPISKKEPAPEQNPVQTPEKAPDQAPPQVNEVQTHE